jgi:hypothetical protein
MNDFLLPAELEKLESELILRSIPPSGDQLRRQIASCVHKSLRREQRLDFWRFAAAAALLAGVWLNMSLCAASATDFHFQLAEQRQSVEQTARRIQYLLPELSESESRREAAMLFASSNLILHPRIAVPRDTIKTYSQL